MAELTPEQIAAQINERIEGFKEMVSKTPNIEAFNALKADFDKFVQDTDISEFETKIQTVEQSLKALKDRVGKISITHMPGGAGLAERIKTALETDEWKEHIERRAEGQSPVYQLKDITWGAAGGNGTNDVVQNFMPFVIPQYPFEEPFDVRSYMPVGTCDTGSLDYPQELLYTNGMGMVSEAGASSETSVTFQMVTENAHRMATFAEVSRRALRNTVWLSQYLANRFMEKWVALLNAQVIAGDNTGENLNGLITQATDYATAGDFEDTIPAGESTLIDAVIALKSFLYNEANVMANACFVSPVTHYKLTVQKSTTREYAYDQVLAQVDSNGVWRLNGMMLVMSKDVPDDNALIGLVSPNTAQILLNGGIDMDTTNSHASNFTSALVAFRFEADVLFPVYRPYAFAYGDLTTIQGDITSA